MSRVTVRSCLVFVACLLACSSGDAEPTLPPPLPAPPATPVVAEPVVEPEAPVARPAKPAAPTSKAKPSKPATTRSPVKLEPRAATVPALAPVAVTPAPRPVAVAPPPVPAPTPAPATKRVVVPRTDHVHVELPSGLQSDLDADPRMQKWVDRVIAVADGCHAKNRGATGTIVALLTMHENERPSASMSSLPGQLAGIVPCATGSLLGVKMPLFTGREGTRYTVRIVFE